MELSNELGVKTDPAQSECGDSQLTSGQLFIRGGLVTLSLHNELNKWVGQSKVQFTKSQITIQLSFTDVIIVNIVVVNLVD